MKKLILTLILAFATLCGFALLGVCGAERQPGDFLRTTLENVERIKVAGYEIEEKVKAPYEKEWGKIRIDRIVEQDNPQDSTIGASALRYDAEGHVASVYDGVEYACFYHDDKRIEVNDFTDAQSQALPFRMYGPPFFNYVKSIIRYMLTTSDSIGMDVEESEDDYIYRLSIYEGSQVEFFGRAYRMPHNQYLTCEEDAYSYYTLWIRKSDAMPYRYRRAMSHNINDVTCRNVEYSDVLDSSPIVTKDIMLLHRDYKVHYAGKADADKTVTQYESLIGEPAPEWVLKDVNGNEVSLGDMRGNITIINLTGLGCGPCIQAYPELVELSKRYNVVSIESWGNSAQSICDYVVHHDIEYPVLLGNDAVLDAYVGTSRAMPVFFYLDRDHIVRKIDRGYSKSMISNSLKSLGWNTGK